MTAEMESDCGIKSSRQHISEKNHINFFCWTDYLDQIQHAL